MRFDTFVVNAVAGNAALGVYTVAARVADVVWLVPYSVALVVLPRASGGTAAELDRSTPRLAVRTLGLSLVVAVLLAVAAWAGLSAVFGAAFAGALPALAGAAARRRRVRLRQRARRTTWPAAASPDGSPSTPWPAWS